MRIRTLMAITVFILGALGLVLPGAVAASAAPADIAAASAAAAPPAGESVVQDPYASAAPLRYCPDNYLYAQWDPNCDEVVNDGQSVAVPNGDFVIMRCWIGDGGEETQYSKAWTSRKWFYVTFATGNPETEASGFMYSMVVADQVSTPECGDQFSLYPYAPNDGSISISNRPSAGVLTVDFSSIAYGPATIYCHVGSAAEYATGGTVTDLGTFDINDSNYWDNFVIPVCGAGNQWIGIIASDGIIRYSNQVTIGSSPPPGIITANNNGQLAVQLSNFPLGLSYYFCHAGDPSGYPTGGAITSHGSFTVGSPSQSWSSGLCSGSGNSWIGIQATDGNSYYSNEVTLSSVPPSISAGNDDGQLTVQLSNFPLGTSYYFCHAGDPSGYPTGGAITSHGSFTVSSPNQSWSSGLCSGAGNFWIGIQATDGNSYYSNQAFLGPPPVIATTALPGGVLAKPYSAAVKATAGTGSYHWSITGGALPRGLSLNAASGAITGRPKVSGTFTVVVSVADADGYASSAQFTLRIAALGVKTAALPAGTLHKAYKATLAAYGGKAPLTWSISGGHLPPGLKLSKSGVISGIPAKSGSYILTVEVTDAASTRHSAARTLTLTIKK